MNLLQTTFLLMFVCATYAKQKKNKIKESIETSKNKSTFLQAFKEFKIKSIEGQLSNQVEQKLKNKYWKNAEKNDPEIEIKYEIFEFLDLIVVKGEIKINSTSKKFTIKHLFSKSVPWRQDEVLIDKIAKEIYYKAQFIVHNNKTK